MRETAREQDTKGPFLPWRWHGQQFRRVGGQCKRCSNGRMRPNPLAPIATPAPEASAIMAGRSFYLAWLACHRCCWNARVHMVRLHRAAGLAASRSPESHSQRWMLHICGRKDCMVVAHYRPGDQSANEADKEHHKARPGTSREQHQPWQ